MENEQIAEVAEVMEASEPVAQPEVIEEVKAGEDSNKDQSVPYWRFKKINEELEKTKEELYTLRSEARSLKAKNEKVKEERLEIEKLRQAIAEDRELVRLGLVEDEAAEVARFFYQKQSFPEDQKMSLAEWIKDLQADTSKIPAALRPYMQSSDKKAVAAPNPANMIPTSAPSENPYSPSRIKQMTSEEYKAHKEQILKMYKSQFIK